MIVKIVVRQISEKIIFSARQIESNTEKIVKQTTGMLNKLQKNLESQRRTEKNTLEAAQYAAICANDSRITAFFSMADYLTTNSSE